VTAGADDVLTIDPGHEFEDVLVQLIGPDADKAYQGGPYPTSIINSGFALSFSNGRGDPAELMKCFRSDQLPILNQLAREFAICDHWHSSLPGPTFPNRFFAHAASSGGLDHSPGGGEVAWWETVDGFDFAKGTIYNRLDDAGLRYGFYAGDDLPVVASLSGVSLDDINDFGEHFAEDLKDSGYADLRYVHLEPSYDAVAIPFVSDGKFRSGSSQHPLGDVNKGELFLKQAYEAIRNSPLWESSLLIITWDEHGGFYDHVAPPPAVPPNDGPPPDDDNNQHGFLFDRLGVRVPAIIVSPLIPKNTIDHRVYDHASIPAAIERIFGLQPLTDRDRLVNAPNALCTLMSPRADAPTTLVDPAPSVAAALVGPPTPAELAAPIDPGVLPFVHVAAIEHLKMTTDPAERAAIVANAKAITTYGQASGYVASVTMKARALRQAHRAPGTPA
jgi:phospholipase C